MYLVVDSRRIALRFHSPRRRDVHFCLKNRRAMYGMMPGIQTDVIMCSVSKVCNPGTLSICYTPASLTPGPLRTRSDKPCANFRLICCFCTMWCDLLNGCCCCYGNDLILSGLCTRPRMACWRACPPGNAWLTARPSRRSTWYARSDHTNVAIGVTVRQLLVLQFALISYIHVYCFGHFHTTYHTPVLRALRVLLVSLGLSLRRIGDEDFTADDHPDGVSP